MEDMAGNISYIKFEVDAPIPDPPPNIWLDTDRTERTADNAATVSIKSDKDGYANVYVVDKGDPIPEMAEHGSDQNWGNPRVFFDSYSHNEDGEDGWDIDLNASHGMTAGAKDVYIVLTNSDGNSNVIKVEFGAVGAPPVDTTAPTLSYTGVARTDDGSASVKIKSSEPGEVEYFVVDAGAAQPNFDTATPTGSYMADSSEKKLDLTGLTPGAKDVYIRVEDASGNSSFIKVEVPAHVPAPPVDTTAPSVSIGDIVRTDDNNATLEFTSSESGSYSYIVVTKDGPAPDDSDFTTWNTNNTSEQTLNLSGLAAGEYDVYIRVKDAAGNVSGSVKVELPAAGAVLPPNPPLPPVVPPVVTPPGGSGGSGGYSPRELLVGSEKGFVFQVGPNGGQQVTLYIPDVDSESIGVADTSIATLRGAMAAIDDIDLAMEFVVGVRGKLGAMENRLEFTLQSLGVTEENLSDAESRIRDADMAKEMMELTKSQTLRQVGVAMLAQANQEPQMGLQLLG
jgi:flagellin-like hook-associated protein FlgL